MSSPLSHTITYLKACQQARAARHRLSLTTDPRWLVDMAINRRAGWPDDPSPSRGSCLPINGHYPRKAMGDTYHHLWLIAREVNTPRLIVRVQRLGEHRWLMRKLPYRFTTNED